MLVLCLWSCTIKLIYYITELFVLYSILVETAKIGFLFNKKKIMHAILTIYFWIFLAQNNHIHVKLTRSQTTRSACYEGRGSPNPRLPRSGDRRIASTPSPCTNYKIKVLIQRQVLVSNWHRNSNRPELLVYSKMTAVPKACQIRQLARYGSLSGTTAG